MALRSKASRLMVAAALGLVISATVGADPPRNPVVAVFLMESRSSPLSADEVVGLTDYLSTRLGEQGKFQIIPREELRKRLISQKKNSYNQGYDINFQIELGREMAAEYSISSAISRVGKQCLITASVWDLKAAIQIKAAGERSICNADALIDAVDRIATKLSLAMTSGYVPPETPSYTPAPASPIKNTPSATAPASELTDKAISSRYLTLPTRVFSPSDRIPLRWVGTPGSSNDWVSVATKDMGADNYVTYRYTGGAVNGDFELSGLEPGEYEARLYLNWPKAGYTVADRLAFRVQNPTAASAATAAPGTAIRSKHLGLARAVYAVGEAVEVFWFDTTGNSKDWVTVVRAGTADNQAGDYDYLRGKNNGSYKFTDLKAGDYEARLYLNYRTVGYKVADRLPFSVR